jgi:DNA helicase-2/ATP-dependent DNA helicase PcrA
MTAIRSIDVSPAAASADLPSSGPVPIDGIRELLAGLDRRQRQAVTHGDGPLLVIAGPGTGKTEVITRRVAWLIAGRKARASEILALTFTERAADEMQARVDVLVPYGQADTAIHTFHAFGDGLLREHGHAIGRPDDPRVIGRAQAIVLVRDNIFSMGLDRYLPLGEPARFAGALVDLFGRAKEEGIRPDELAAYATELAAGARAAGLQLEDEDGREAIDGLLDEAAAHAELARAYGAYQQLLMERSLVDHGDQVAEAVRLLQERPSVRMALRRHFRYVVVDEAQDANPQQLQLVRQLVGRKGNVMFVGDDDQAIYSFRGAVGQGLAGLDEAFESVGDIVLRRNYRSRRPILETARRLIRHNDPDRLEIQRGVDKTLTAVRRSRRPALVKHHAHATSSEEADAVAAEIRARLADGAPASSIAILVRTNGDALPMLASLDVLGIPRHFSGASGLLKHREVRDVLSLLAAIADPGSSDDLYAVMTARPYNLGGQDLTAICERASRRRRSLWSVITELVEQPGTLRVSTQTRDALARLVSGLRHAIEDAHERPAPPVLYDALRRSGWLKHLIADAERGDEGPLRRVARFFEIVSEQAELTADPRMAVVVPALRALIDAGQDPAAPGRDHMQEAVSVLTVHQAKGLEFALVFMIGLAEGRFPIRARRDSLTLPHALTGRPPQGDPDAHRAEERRLFYVAVTRARDELLLSHAAAGTRGGRHRRPSTFLAEALGGPIAEHVEHIASDALTSPATGPASASPPPSAPKVQSPLTLSFTQIDDYLSCPLKYKLRHRSRVPTPPHHALVVGNALHQAVAVANKARLRRQEVDAEGVGDTLSTHWKSEGFLSQEHEAARFAAGQAALTRFLERTATATDDILAVEEPFSVRIGSDRVRGRYDAVRRTGGHVVITDYKSGDMKDPERARIRARDSLQLQLYALAWEAEHGTQPGAVELHFLEGDVIGRVTPTDRQLERTRQKVAAAAAGIRAGDFDATPGYPACDWCPYRRMCPAAV